MSRSKLWIWALASLLQTAIALDADDDSGPDFIHPESNILFLGDSITQGGTYIAYIQAYLWGRYPERHYNLINLGLGSETVSGLSETDHPFPRPDIHNRIDRALAAAQPDLTFICYGMNDGIYHPPSRERFDAHIDGMKRLIAKVRATGSDIILLTPPPFDAETKRIKKRPLVGVDHPDFGYKTPYAHYDRVLAQFGEWARQQSGEGIIQTIDIHTPLKNDIAAQRSKDPSYLYGDGIHPNNRGHWIIALTILQSLHAPGIESASDFSALSTTNALGQAMPAILERHRLVSAAWREHVGHSKPRKEETPPLEEALRIASSQEKRIREALSAP